MKILFRAALAGLLLLSASALVARADDAADDAANAALHKVEVINTGEVRLDGRITAVTGQNEWLLEATSFTSPRNITKEFDAPKPKTVIAGADIWIHPRGNGGRLGLDFIKLGTLVGVIGKDGGSGNPLAAREIVLAADAGTSHNVGTIMLPRSVSLLVGQARELRAGGKSEQALPIYQDALAAAQRLNHHVGEGFVLRAMGSTYTELGQDQKAIEAYKAAVDVARAADDVSGLASSLNGMGLGLGRQGKSEEALTALQAADEAASSLGVPLRSVILSNLVSLYFKTDKIVATKTALRRLIPLEESNNQAGDAVGDELSLVELLRADKAEDPLPTLVKAKDSLAKLPEDKVKAGLLSRLGSLQWKLGKRDEARVSWESGAKLAEQIGETKLAKQIRGIAALYEVTEGGTLDGAAKPDADIPDADKPNADKPEPPRPVAIQPVAGAATL